MILEGNNLGITIAPPETEKWVPVQHHSYTLDGATIEKWLNHLVTLGSPYTVTRYECEIVAHTFTDTAVVQWCKEAIAEMAGTTWPEIQKRWNAG